MRVNITFQDTDEEYGSGEFYQYGREVDELNPYDMLEYLLEASRVGGFEWSKMSSVGTKSGVLFETED